MQQIRFSNIKSFLKWRYSLLILAALFSVVVYGATATRFFDVIIKDTLSVGSNTTPNSKAALDVVSTTKGLLPPRMTTVQRDAISSPPAGLTLFNSTTGYFNYYNGSAWRETASLTGTETFTNKTLTSPTMTDPTTNLVVFDDQGSTPSSPSAGFYKVYAKTDGKVYILNSLGVESLVGGSGGGGGTSLQWSEQSSAPIYTEHNNAQTYAFASGASQQLYADLRVPESYSAGDPISFHGLFYCNSTSDNFQMTAVATLIRSESDDVASTTNTWTSTNSAITMSSANDDELQKIEFDLTSGVGQINSQAVAPGDLIKIRLYRASDSATCDVYFVYNATEVSLQ